MPPDPQLLIRRILALPPAGLAEVEALVDDLAARSTAPAPDWIAATAVGGPATGAPPSDADAVQDALEAAREDRLTRAL